MKLRLFGDRGASRTVLACVFSVLVVLVVGMSTWANAQTIHEAVTVFSDPNGGSCTLVDDSEAPLSVYVIAKTSGTVNSRFRVASSEGFNADYLSEVIHMPFHTGDLRTGIDITYAYCAIGAVLLATMTYAGHGTSSPCSYLEVQAHPESYDGSIEVITCTFDTFRGVTLGPLLVNSSQGQCTPWCVVGVRSSTWGAVKAFYR